MASCCSLPLQSLVEGVGFLRLFLLTLLVLFSQSNSSLSQTPESVSPSVPRPVLAYRSDVVDLNSFSELKDFIPEELLPDLREGSFAFRKSDELGMVFRFDKEWMNAAQGIGQFSIGTDGAIQGDGFLPNGPAFALVLQSDAENLPENFGQKLLWNTYSHWWRLGMLRSSFSLVNLKDERISGESHGEVARIFPSVYSEKFRQQFFRERVKLEVPELGAELERLTFRLFGQREDTVWASSPVLFETRRIAGSNRADPLPFAVLSLEDIFTFSGKVEIQKPSEVSSRTVFMPFAENEVVPLVKRESDSCFEVKEPESKKKGVDAQFRWNFEARTLSTGAGWLPVNTTYVQRGVWRVVSLVLDPYSLEGWQVLYVDQETLLPMYRFVFDKTGRLWKTILSSFGLAETEDKSFRIAYPIFTAVRDHVSGQASLLNYEEFQFCPQDLADRESEFLPSVLGPKSEVTEEGSSAKGE